MRIFGLGDIGTKSGTCGSWVGYGITSFWIFVEGRVVELDIARTFD